MYYFVLFLSICLIMLFSALTNCNKNRNLNVSGCKNIQNLEIKIPQACTHFIKRVEKPTEHTNKLPQLKRSTGCSLIVIVSSSSSSSSSSRSRSSSSISGE
jgi:hypothetical protein